MNRKVLILLAAALPACTLAQVVNGDFEVPLTVNASGPPGYVTVYSGDNTSIGGWLSGGRAGDVSVDVVSHTGFGYQAYTGDQMLDLAGTPGPGSVLQYVATTAGQQYTLSFAASSNGSPKVMDIYWGDGVNPLDVITCPALGTWGFQSYTVTATGASTLLMFGSDLGNGTNAGPLLDTVSLTPVPEPATVAILGLGAISLLRRRKALHR